ncbi:MAG: cytidine deaminase [Ruminococcus sp.]|nr:cytidine deaminase [Ruminococcus sp.]
MNGNLYGELFQTAVKAAEKAYADYSGFRVGAALLSADGRVFTGCNIENSSYSLTICAERTAVFKAVSEGVREFAAIAVVGSSGGDFSKPCCPCGACLQVLGEFCGGDLPVILADGTYKLSDFMPITFTKENLK